MKNAIAAVLLLATTPLAAAQIRFTTFDQNHSTIGFTVPIAGGMSEVQGKFTSFSADFLFDDQDVTKSTVSVVVQASSINTGIPDRDEDLRSSHFFDVATYPEIRFASSSVAKRGDDLVVTGTLTMHGVRQPLELVCHLAPLGVDQKSGKVFIGGSAAAAVDRRQFGITWEHPVPGFVGDHVGLSIHFITKLTPREPKTDAPVGAASPDTPRCSGPHPGIRPGFFKSRAPHSGQLDGVPWDKVLTAEVMEEARRQRSGRDA